MQHSYQEPTEEYGEVLPIDLRMSSKFMKEEEYICECGKCYFSFSALALHIRFKHDKRLNQKENTSNFKVEETNNKKIFTYFLEQIPKNQNKQYNIVKDECPLQQDHSTLPKNISNEQKVQNFLQSYEYEKRQEGLPFTTVHLILRGFMDYLEELEQQKKTDPSLEIPEDITLLFNEFVVYYVAEVRKNTSLASFKKQKIVQVMFEFGNWLKRKGLSEYILTQNQASKKQEEL